MSQKNDTFASCNLPATGLQAVSSTAKQPDMIKRILLTTLCTVALTLMASGQQLPQFAYNDFEGWTYSGGTLTEDAISRGIYLYVTSQGHMLTLSSPVFQCNGIDSIAALVRWRSSDPTIGLTTVIDDALGQPIDSVTCYPTSSSSSQKLTYTIAVPKGLAEARLRFISPEADVTNCGAVKSIELTAVTATASTTGDVNRDGIIDITDVTILISHMLGIVVEGIDTAAADINHDGEISINDVTALISRLLNGR